MSMRLAHADLLRRLDKAEKDTTVAVNLLWDTPSVMARFENTGPLPRQVAIELGIVGPAARASGLARDIRHDQPSGIFRFVHIPVSTCDTGDVFARAFVRWLEIQQSIEFIREQLRTIPAGHDPDAAGFAVAEQLCRYPQRRMARRGLPCGHHRRPGPTLPDTRLWIRRSTTGLRWPTPCAIRRFQTFHCATRALICPIADMIYENEYIRI